MNSLLSYITVLPSTEKEMEAFKRGLKQELLVSDPYLRKQLYLLRKMFDELLSDTQLDEYWLDL